MSNSDAIASHVHDALLSHLLSSSSPPLSFIVTDVTLSSVISVTENIRLPNSHSSLRRLGCCHSSCFPSVPSSIPKALLPSPLLDTESFLAKDLSENGKCIKRSDGVIFFAPSEWLENQRESSVVDVSFGSRTAMSKEQIRELGKGLVLSGYKFSWVVKRVKPSTEKKMDPI
ncbi:UDP-glycosyltransferase 13-like [Hibiscus syriacus]|uniref:UDP-glycosyltransferase 13-like n=1 Tax=Hibiscus syriacus TaxID=106335 RepID=UPI001920C1C8|nr:UDP-glycosyltransferase 13-like [Hibiscus syriacus]